MTVLVVGGREGGSGRVCGQNKINAVRSVVLSLARLSRCRKVVVYNSLAMKRVELLRLRVDTVWMSVVNGYGNGEKVQCQINLVWSKDNALELDQFELVFPVTSEGVSLSVYQLVPAKEASCSLGNVQLGNIPVSHTDIAHLGQRFEVAFQVEKVSGKDVVLSQGPVSATFSGKTGLLKGMSVGGVSTEVETDFVMYSAAPGRERSGAYLFLPAGEASSIVSQSKDYPMRIVTGPLVSVGLCSRRGSSDLVGVSVQCWIVPGALCGKTPVLVLLSCR